MIYIGPFKRIILTTKIGCIGHLHFPITHRDGILPGLGFSAAYFVSTTKPQIMQRLSVSSGLHGSLDAIAERHTGPGSPETCPLPPHVGQICSSAYGSFPHAMARRCMGVIPARRGHGPHRVLSVGYPIGGQSSHSAGSEFRTLRDSRERLAGLSLIGSVPCFDLMVVNILRRCCSASRDRQTLRGHGGAPVEMETRGLPSGAKVSELV